MAPSPAPTTSSSTTSRPPQAIKVGDTIDILNHPFHVCGIVEHGKGGRKFIPIDTMDDIDGTPGKATRTSISRPTTCENQEDVRKEILATPGMSQYNVQTLDELLSLLTPDRLPGFNIGLRVVIGIAVIIGFLVIFQSMYTAVMERTREIGILKSLGASRLYIVAVVLRETGPPRACRHNPWRRNHLSHAVIFHYRFPTLDFAVTPRTGSVRRSRSPSLVPCAERSIPPSRPPAKTLSTPSPTSDLSLVLDCQNSTSRQHIEGLIILLLQCVFLRLRIVF